jgi:phage-related protein
MKAVMAKQVQGICRSVYMVRFPGAVYILHAFQKKSKSGIRTPQEDVS